LEWLWEERIQKYPRSDYPVIEGIWPAQSSQEDKVAHRSTVCSDNSDVRSLSGHYPRGQFSAIAPKSAPHLIEASWATPACGTAFDACKAGLGFTLRAQFSWTLQHGIQFAI
jgi:hypothetical protein